MQTLAAAPLLMALTCPQFHVDLEIQTYTGPVYYELCTAPGGFQATGGNMYISLYNPEEDGIFKNGFDDTR